MDQNITPLCDIDPMIDDLKVLGRCISLWKSHHAGRPNEVWALDMVFQDAQINHVGQEEGLANYLNIMSVQNTNVSMGVGSSSPNLYTPNATNAILPIANIFTNETSKNNPKSCFKNKTPVPFDIGSPIIPANVNTATTTNAKGKSISIIPDFKPYDEDNQDGNVYTDTIKDSCIPDFEPCDEDIEDQYGYSDRIEGISKEYHDHGDPAE
ncbi:hypothetical protein Tco_1039634 [Tanacetum coccineum]